MKYYYHFMSKNKVIDNQRVSKLSVLTNGSENLKLNIAQYRTWIEPFERVVDKLFCVATKINACILSLIFNFPFIFTFFITLF